MNEYRIQSMKLLNFCGIQSLEINPDGEDLTVYGDNATGKTKISGIKSIDPTSAKGKKIFSSADAVMAYSPVEHGVYINKNVLKNPEALAAYNKQAQEAWDTVMKNMDSLTGAQREIAMRYKEAGRSLVGDGSAHDYFVHEMGHHIQWEAFDAKTNNRRYLLVLIHRRSARGAFFMPERGTDGE